MQCAGKYLAAMVDARFAQRRLRPLGHGQRIEIVLVRAGDVDVPLHPRREKMRAQFRIRRQIAAMEARRRRGERDRSARAAACRSDFFPGNIFRRVEIGKERFAVLGGATIVGRMERVDRFGKFRRFSARPGQKTRVRARPAVQTWVAASAGHCNVAWF